MHGNLENGLGSEGTAAEMPGAWAAQRAASTHIRNRTAHSGQHGNETRLPSGTCAQACLRLGVRSNHTELRSQEPPALLILGL